MADLPRALAGPLPPDRIRLATDVTAIEPGLVRTRDTDLRCRRIIVATDPPAAARRGQSGGTGLRTARSAPDRHLRCRPRDTARDGRPGRVGTAVPDLDHRLVSPADGGGRRRAAGGCAAAWHAARTGAGQQWHLRRRRPSRQTMAAGS